VIPTPLRAAVEARLGPLGEAAPVAGGCISRGARVETAGDPVFLKHHPGAPAGFFAAEARGLEALRAAGCGLAVPAPLAWAEAQGGAPAWIAIEWLEPAPPGDGHGERLGRGLAALHRSPAGGGWGWEADGFIGSLPQANAPSDDWAVFWRARRLEPQLARARRAGLDAGPTGDWERLFARLPDLLAPATDDGPSLLHGDLWSGNVLSTLRGPALIDPAAYRGHREADLAMAELFGGFGAAFHAAYREAWPLAPGWPARRAVYQLWYLLVHLNLFGAGYAPQVASALRDALAG
jgi:protein-ribulosamine 3-kinase